MPMYNLIEYHGNYSKATFAIAWRKLYVPSSTLSTQDNAKLLQKLKSGFKRTID